MAFLTYEGVGITAMAAAVPRCVVDNYKYTQYFPEDQVKEVVDKIGIYERRFADADTCSSDLCFAAAPWTRTNVSTTNTRKKKRKLICWYLSPRLRIIGCLLLLSFFKID